MYPNVAVIILNWNGWHDTLECLESLYRINYPNYNIIIVDNDSNDDSIQKIKKYCNGEIKVESKFFQYQTKNKPLKTIEYTEKEVENNSNLSNSVKNQSLPSNSLIIIKADKNHGFAGGNNIGINYAINNLKTDYILLLNNDTVVDPDFMTELVNTGESSDDIGFVGAKTYFYNKENTIQVAGGANVSFKYIISLEMGLNQIDNGSYDQNTELDYIGGSCVLCKVEMIKKIGLMDTKYFMYWEDADWGFRGSNASYKSVYSFKSKIWHKVGASSKSHFQEYYFNRNRMYFMKKNRKNLDYIEFLAYFFTSLFWHESHELLINKKDLKGFKIYFKALLNGIFT